MGLSRRTFLSITATPVITGCSDQKPASGVTSPSDLTPTAGWSQYRGGAQRQGHTTKEFSRLTTIDEMSFDSQSAPIINRNTAIIITGDEIIKLDLRNPPKHTRYSLVLQPTLPPAYSQSILVVQTRENIFGINMDNGKEEWKLSASGTYRKSAAPAAFDAYFVIQDANRLRLVERSTGKSVWERRFSGRVEGFATTTKRLAVNHTTDIGKTSVEILDPRTGETKTMTRISMSRLHPVISEGIYTASGSGEITAQSGGEINWQTNIELSQPKALSNVDDILIVGPDSAGLIVALNRRTGEPLWQTTIPSGQSLITYDSQAIVSSLNNGLFSIDTTTGEQTNIFSKARFATKLAPFDNGIVYVGSADDKVVLVRS